MTSLADFAEHCPRVLSQDLGAAFQYYRVYPERLPLGKVYWRRKMRTHKHSELSQALLLLAILLGMRGNAVAGKKRAPTPFKYVGGTESLRESCKGLVEVGSSELTFRCKEGTVSVPYESITLMQYRPNISRKIQRMKINWKVKPHFGGSILGGNKNRYFAIIYQVRGTTGALVLDVPPNTMRPYLAEIDVKSGKRVEVKETEEVD